MTDTLSVSIESLDEGECAGLFSNYWSFLSFVLTGNCLKYVYSKFEHLSMEIVLNTYNAGTSDGDYDEEIEMMMQGPDAEAWSVTVDKKTLKKMSAKDIKRQDHIWGKDS